MKRIILCVFLIVPVFCFAQNKRALSHFWDIPWGTSIDRAEAIFTERGFESMREGTSLMTVAAYEGEEAVIMLLFNRVNRLYSGNVIYTGTPESVLEKYDDFRKVLYRRYGPPDRAVEYYEEPYLKGDGKAIEAISTENAFFFTEWQFGDTNQASVAILQNLDVCLTFRSPSYADPATAVR
ncbi:MAG: hypothetical protein FWH19_05165 [Treponema sp.]|nr:hypothetical protein [Treponema sp.]